MARRIEVALPFLVVLLATTPKTHAQQWIPHGPGPNTKGQVENITDRPVVGALNAVAPHPTDANTIYVGAVNGGIWKTNNAMCASPSWVEQLGTARSLSIGSLEFDATDATNQTVVAGSGQHSSFFAGGDRVGLWRTTDGGTTWTGLDGGGKLVGLNVSGVAPRGATIVIAVDDAPAAANRGIWRTTNTGASWTKISGGAGTGLPAGLSFDLSGDRADNKRLFTNAGPGVFVSNDTGAHWRKVSNAAMDRLAAGGGRIEIAVGISSGVYVAIVNRGKLAGLFRSPDGGTTWTPLDLPRTTEDAGTTQGIHPGSLGNTHLSITADPTNANIVYVGGDRQPDFTELSGAPGEFPTTPNSIGAREYSGRLFRVDASRPARSQATHITHSHTSTNSAPHADSRDMAFAANGDLLETDDGGIYRRTTPQTDSGDWLSLIGNIAVTEFHAIAWDAVSKVIIGGAQDTGVPEEVLPMTPRWQSVLTADGGDVAVDDKGSVGVSVRYSSINRLGRFSRRKYDRANKFIDAISPALEPIGTGAHIVPQFYTPIQLNNVTPKRLIIGGANSVYESDDQGDSVTEIGPGIVVNEGGQDPIAYGATGNADILYVGSGDQIFVRTAAAPAVLASSVAYLGRATGRQVVGIAINPSNGQAGFAIDSTNVYRTPDAGATWTNITANLATLAPGNLRSIAFSSSNADGTIIVGSDAGAFALRGPTFATWAALGSGLPRVPVYDLDYDADDEVLLAGTLGRGAWTLNLSERR